MVDPWGGSYFMESLTESVYQAANALIDEVEALGGMTKAIVAGMPKLRIEEAATRRQARVDSGEDVIVGVNKYPLARGGRPRRARHRQQRGARGADAPARGDPRAARRRRGRARARRAARELAKSGEGNLLAAAVDAARARAHGRRDLAALEDVYTRHRAEVTRGVGRVRRELPGRRRVRRGARARWRRSPRREGRRPRMLVVKLGQDGHDRGMKVIATAFADLGFDVDVGPLFQTPEEAARQAIDNDVHVIGVSSQAAGHKTLVPELVQALARAGRAADRRGGRRHHPAARLRVPARERRRGGVRSRHRGAEGRARGARRWSERGVDERARGASRAAAASCDGDPRAATAARSRARSRCSRARAPITPSAAQEILDALVPDTGGALRVGITGPPGVGQEHVHRGARPPPGRARATASRCSRSIRRSPVTGGSILGDKTRMERLAQRDEAFIRPSPSGGTLGGVAQRTREAMLVCEAAGYDVVIVETVGDRAVRGRRRARMVDFFLVLLQPGAGDELQGIKKGVLELADALVVNKADGERARARRPHARRATSARSSSCGRSRRPGARACSPRAAQTGEGVGAVWEMVLAHRDGAAALAARPSARRREQARAWMWSLVDEGLRARVPRPSRAWPARSRRSRREVRGPAHHARARRSRAAGRIPRR